ncbi:sensor histidine kinase [Sphaerisporangium sp. TRM90804]|uniref:sensor histidine kinase n=1 Tax=Sphaerisporangium sp. TRM90804 TaxID=3031113 RepID=UPI002448E7A0|nr:sensor histidine kinase [Sphaerisporangium sp. TRM90804]MDH2429626.1 sensor histidine kinase [Sphaerisporangium sp. TRM90804]
MSSIIAGDPVAARQVLVHADQILTDVIESLRSGEVRLDDSHKRMSYESGVTRAASGMHPRESLRTAAGFFSAVVNAVRRDLERDEHAVDLFGLVSLALNESTMQRLGGGLTTYSGYLLNKIHESHIEERRRIARELHDRVGLGLSVAQRQLEAHEFYEDKDSAQALNRVAAAQQGVREAMQSLRAVTSELRLQEPLKSLEKALLNYLETLPQGMGFRLYVNGDETWAPATVRDESFLVIREAIRNAVAHGRAEMILVSVEIAPHELRGSVDDNGGGFDVDDVPASGGMGLSTMRERAELMGGTITIMSRPGRGTHAELVIPLQGR